MDQLGLAELSSLPAATRTSANQTASSGSGDRIRQRHGEDLASRLEHLFAMDEPAAYMGDSSSSSSLGSASSLSAGAAGSCVAVAASSGDVAALVRGNRLVVCGARALTSSPFSSRAVIGGDGSSSNGGGGGGSSSLHNQGLRWRDVQLLDGDGSATSLPPQMLFTAIGFDAQVSTLHNLNIHSWSTDFSS